jgi:hypothetical protein
MRMRDREVRDYKTGITPDPKGGYGSDTLKKSNYPTSSDQSQYAKDALEEGKTLPDRIE